MGLYLLPWTSVLDIITHCFGLKSYLPIKNDLDKLAWNYENRVTYCFAAETASTAQGVASWSHFSVSPLLLSQRSVWVPLAFWAWRTGLPHALEMLRQPQLQNLCYPEALFKNNSTTPLFSCKHFSKRQFEVRQGLLTEIRPIFYNEFSEYLERILRGKHDWLLVSKITIFQKQNA